MLEDYRYKGANGIRAVRRWVIPYLASRIQPHKFRPVLCYLYTDWRCNADCHYCFQYNNTAPGMEMEVAKESIDWLKSIGCRVLPLMGGEPLVRKDFVLEVIEYAARQGFFVYLPTNGQLMDRAFIDDMGRAGVAAVNLAVDCLEPLPGLPKALSKIEDQFDYLIECQKKYGYLLFFNTNICRNNIGHVRKLTEIAHGRGLGTDYHLNEAPHDFVEIDHYRHSDNPLYITPDQWDEIDDLLDWLIERHDQGWPMVNPVAHLRDFKDRARGRIPDWDCRAGINGALIRPDGSLAPCFDLITYYDHDWGTIWDPKFDRQTLAEVKKDCLPKCSSTCFYTMGHYYDFRSIPEWIKQHVRVG